MISLNICRWTFNIQLAFPPFELTIKQWHFEWDYVNTGRLTQRYFPKVYTHINKKQITFSNLHKPWRVPSISAQILIGGNARMRLRADGNFQTLPYSLPTPQRIHLVDLTPKFEQIWQKQLTQNKSLQAKDKAVIRWLIDNKALISY